MSSNVRAAVMLGPGRLEVQQFAMPEPEPGAVVLKMQFSGVCGTDKHTFRGETKQYAGTPHERDVPFPIIPGHENVGIVAATGGEVPINPNLHFCIKNIRLLGIGGEAATAYGPTMKVPAKAQHQWPLGEIVTHRFGLDQAEEAVKTSMADGAMKVVIGAG